MSERFAKEKLKLHFIYIVIILVLSNVMIGAFLLFGKKNALAHLSSAGTLLSIVLAIVAILITLWDIAGQKNSIYEIKEQIEKIKNVSDDIVNTSETIKENAEASDDILNSLKDFEEKSGANFEKLGSRLSEVIVIVEQLNGPNQNDEEKQKVLDELNKIQSDLKISQLSQLIKEAKRENETKASKMLKNEFKAYLKQFSIDELTYYDIRNIYNTFVNGYEDAKEFSLKDASDVYREFTKNHLI